MATNPTFTRGAAPNKQDDPSWDGIAITPGASELASWPRALYIGGAGDVVVVTANDTELKLLGAVAGSIIPLVCKKVLSASTDSPATSTTATGIVGLL